MLGGRASRAASDAEEAPGLRELAIEGLIGTVALYFLVKTAPDGLGGFWWVCVALFGVGLVSFLRDAWRAWARRSQARPAAVAREGRGSTGNGAGLDGE
jgi:hypothetical protein